MRAHHYETCQDCGTALTQTTAYQRHAYCADCSGIAAH
jgi:hypothetical protein